MRIVADFEGANPMRLQFLALKNAVDAFEGNARGPGQASRAPVRRVGSGLRGSCSIPLILSSANRFRHRPTHSRSVASPSAIAALVIPSAARRTMRARRTSRAGVARPRDHFVSLLLSSSVRVIDTATRMHHATTERITCHHIYDTAH